MSRYVSKRALKRRLSEPSTWAGIAILLSVAGSAVGLPPDVTNVLVGLGAAAAGVLPEGPTE